MATPVLRCDAGEVQGVERTPEGFLRVRARLTRTGVLRYRDSAGNEWSEYRPPAEVFAADSLASLRGRPLTDKHPKQPVTAETWSEVAKGHVGEDVAREGPYVAATVTVHDAAEVARIEREERRDISAGYRCEIDPTPGVTPEGERYDAVQRMIRYNHAALLAPGEGRAGTDVGLRMDGAAIEVVAAPAGVAAEPRADGAQERVSMATPKVQVLKVRGREIRLDAEDGPVQAQAAVDEMATTDDKAAASSAAALDAAKTALTEALTKISMLEAALAAKTAIAAGAGTPSAGASTAAAEDAEAVLDAAVEARLVARETARAVGLTEKEVAGQPTRALQKAIVAKAFPAVKCDALDAKAIETLYQSQRDAHQKATAQRADAGRKVADVLVPTPDQAAQVARADEGAANENPGATLQQKLEQLGKAPLNTNPTREKV
jgi:hypothetical protein